MTAPAVQTFDSRQPMIVNPSEIRPGDWVRDLGKLRMVESVETTSERIAPGIAANVRFVDDEDGRYGTLSVPEGIEVTVWRAPADPAGDGRV